MASLVSGQENVVSSLSQSVESLRLLHLSHLRVLVKYADAEPHFISAQRESPELEL